MSGTTTPATTTPTTPAAAAPQPGTSAYVNSLPQGSPERAQAAAELYAGRQQQGSALAPERPEGVPEKFWDAENGHVNTALLLSSYKALETRMSQGAQGGNPAATPPAQPATPAPGTAAAPGTQTPPTTPTGAAAAISIPEGADPVVSVVTQAGLNPDALNAKIAAKGDIDEADYAAVEKLGIPRALVQSHVAAIKQLVSTTVQQNNAQVHTLFGNEQNTQAALAWAAQNMPKPEVERLNGMLKGPDFMLAAEVLHARFTKAMPAEPNLRPGGGDNTPTTSGYRSVAERTADMQKPEYRTDPRFREAVRQRMAVSTYDLDRR
jgi:hypothetical protein